MVSKYSASVGSGLDAKPVHGSPGEMIGARPVQQKEVRSHVLRGSAFITKGREAETPSHGAPLLTW